MNVVCYSPWRAASLLWQPRPGAWALTVACHAVFELAAGESPLVPKPLPPAPLDGASDDRSFVEPWGPVAPVKRQPEVMVVGHAYAPPGSKVTSLVARLGVGDLEKLIQVQGDSYFSQEGSLVGPAPFARMPLRWERAAGAPYTSNPLGAGMGPEAVADTHGHVVLPNLLPVGTFVSRRDQVVPPIGFGPIRPGWPSRTERLHRHAATWDPERWAEHALPDDFDVSYFNAAPPDQRVREITGSERIVLEYLHPRVPRLVTYLRAPAPCVVVSSMGVDQCVPLQCDTLVFDTDRGVAILVWRGQVPLAHPQQEGVVFVSSAPLGAGPTGTVEGAAAPRSKAALPFEGGAMETLVGSSLPARPALPFAGDAAETLPRSSFPTKPAVPFEGDAGETLPHSSLPTKPAVPFRLPEAEPELPPADDTAEREPTTLRPVAASAEPPPETQPPALTAIPEAAPPAFVPPPPIRSPVVEVVDEPPPPPPPPPPRPTVASSIEHCATVAARLAAPGADRAAILEAEELTPALWESQHARWLGEINDELDRGKKKLLSAYDTAYVAALEDGRGPISAGEYARLSVAVDRGKIATLLAELDLPGDAIMRIRRVWLARMVKDPRAAADVRAAMRAAREA
jgi:Uncharacterized protein conserved in bacteria (DUF2169)